MWKSRISKLIIIAILGNYTPSQATAKNFLPTGLEIGFDIARLPYYLWKEKTGGQYEFHSSVYFNKILLDIDYGLGSICRKNPPTKPVRIISDNWGQYYRIGLSYNFIPTYRENNAAFLGLMYSLSIFRDALYGNYFDAENIQVIDSKVSVDKADKFHAQWLEVVAGVRIQPWQWVYIGGTIRYKFAKRISPSKKLSPFDIIGWGLQEEDNAWGVNYYIGIRIPLRSNIGQSSVTSAKSNQVELSSSG